MEWLYFFFGTPRRALATVFLLAVLGIVHSVWPGAIGRLLAGGLAELMPILTCILTVVLVVIAIRVMFRGFR